MKRHEFLIFIVFHVAVAAEGSEKEKSRRKKLFEEVIKNSSLWKKQPLKLVINVSLFSFFTLNKQYPYNKRWQKVCAILISVRHGRQAAEAEERRFFVLQKFFIYSLLNYKNLLIVAQAQRSRIWMRRESLNFHITPLHNERSRNRGCLIENRRA